MELRKPEYSDILIFGTLPIYISEKYIIWTRANIRIVKNSNIKYCPEHHPHRQGTDQIRVQMPLCTKKMNLRFWTIKYFLSLDNTLIKQLGSTLKLKPSYTPLAKPQFTEY